MIIFVKKILKALLITLLFYAVWIYPSYAEDQNKQVEYDYDIYEEYYMPDDVSFREKQRAIIELSGIATNGNSRTGSLYFGADVLYKQEKNWIYFNGSSYYTETSKINARILETRLVGGHDLNSRNYVFIMGNLQHDLFQRLDNRSSLVIGYAYYLISVPYEELALELGLGGQSEDFDGIEDESYTEGRLAIDYIFRLSDTARFENKTEFLASLKNKKDYRLRSEFRVLDVIYKNIGMLIKAVIDYDGAPADSDVEKLDTRIFAGITFDFF